MTIASATLFESRTSLQSLSRKEGDKALLNQPSTDAEKL
jgi:hypothetical protein